jgi:twitching motility protein PilT
MAVFEDDLSLLVHELNSSAGGAKTVAAKTELRGMLDGLLSQAAARGASDVILVAGAPITIRVNGALVAGAGKVLSAEELRGMLLPLLTAEQGKELEASRAVDLWRMCIISGGRWRRVSGCCRRRCRRSSRCICRR